MTLKDSFFYAINTEILKKTWEIFSDEINGKFKYRESLRARVKGPIYVYEINAKLYDFNFKINQTVYINPGSNDQPTPLTYTLTKKTNQKIYLYVWEKGFFEIIFGLNKLNTGIEEIDKKYSIKTNSMQLKKLILSNKKLRENLISPRIHFHIETQNKTMKIILKRSGISDSIEDFKTDIEQLNIITNEMVSL